MPAAQSIRAFGSILCAAQLAAGDFLELQGACVHYEHGDESRMTALVRVMSAPGKGERGYPRVRGWLMPERRWGELTALPDGAIGRLVSREHAEDAWKLPRERAR